MMVSGFCLSVVAGLAFPLSWLLFGKIVDAFIYHNTVTREVDNTTVSLLAQSQAQSLNMSCDTLVHQDSSVLDNISDINPIRCLSNNQATRQHIANFACEPSSQLQSEILVIALYYLGVAAVNLLTAFTGSLLFTLSASRQTQKIREAFYHSILHQDISWFDTSNTSELSNRLVE